MVPLDVASEIDMMKILFGGKVLKVRKMKLQCHSGEGAGGEGMGYEMMELTAKWNFIMQKYIMQETDY